ncbi:class I SAM-dependent methyltransferase [Gloeobacter violaceus]|uniref:Glr4305 protein n=1 Tax=Gloeobacter violaceus (strain ATCC 29082 / PCC 7421) TaxID=251221 RepID=Q7NDD0_GLOVI|nr:class I SAM-dependent methyltransferase [Gloeobacter violaceus]BAC92246.1 glr4305 [Gloeobacter violaceus PCC 7421]
MNEARKTLKERITQGIQPFLRKLALRYPRFAYRAIETLMSNLKLSDYSPTEESRIADILIRRLQSSSSASSEGYRIASTLLQNLTVKDNFSEILRIINLLLSRATAADRQGEVRQVVEILLMYLKLAPLASAEILEIVEVCLRHPDSEHAQAAIIQVCLDNFKPTDASTAQIAAEVFSLSRTSLDYLKTAQVVPEDYHRAVQQLLDYLSSCHRARSTPKRLVDALPEHLEAVEISVSERYNAIQAVINQTPIDMDSLYIPYNIIDGILRKLNREPKRLALEGLSAFAYVDTNFYLDKVYTRTKRSLMEDTFWRYGPEYIRIVAQNVCTTLLKYTSIVGKSYCEMGCGVHHPFGVSAAMYINGTVDNVAVDISEADIGRAAEAIYELLTDVLARPSDWHWSGIERSAFLERIYHFELAALKRGDLAAGLSKVALRHAVMDIQQPTVPQKSIQLMSSWAVLEHFLDFPMAARQMFALMAEGGIAFHLIDLRDHRVYSEPHRYHEWSMLAEDETWTDGLVNRLRAQEFKVCFEQAGFEILELECVKQDLPDGFEGQVQGRFAQMSLEELRTVTVTCVLKKPVLSKDLGLQWQEQPEKAWIN